MTENDFFKWPLFVILNVKKISLFIVFIFYMGQTAVKLSGAEAANRAQCAAPD